MKIASGVDRALKKSILLQLHLHLKSQLSLEKSKGLKTFNLHGLH